MKKNLVPFLVGVLVGAIVTGAVGSTLFYLHEKNEEEELVLDGEEEYEEEPAVFSDAGNLKISDETQEMSIEIIPPEGFSVSEDESTLYSGEYYNGNGSLGMSYYIGEYTADEMVNYYDDYIAFMSSNELSGGYSNIQASEVKTMEANGYNVNYIQFSYTYGDESEQENYVEYTAYVMINDKKQIICSLFGYEGDVSEDLIKECFNFEIPVE